MLQQLSLKQVSKMPGSGPQWPLGPHLTWLLCNISCKAGDEFSWVRCHHPECQVLWDLCQRLLLCNSLCKLAVLSCQGMKDAITYHRSGSCRGVLHGACAMRTLQRSVIPCSVHSGPFSEQDRTVCLFSLLSHHISYSLLDMTSTQDTAV